ncbi:hypothetical protein JCM4914_10560 [Streptomyces platensis subsp. malvinus]
MLVPLGVVTVTWTTPEPGGEVAVRRVSDVTVNEAAGTAPKRTAVAPLKPVPVTVTPVPPVAGPEAGDTEPTVGPDAAANRSSEAVVEWGKRGTAGFLPRSEPRPTAKRRAGAGSFDGFGPARGGRPLAGKRSGADGGVQAVIGRNGVRCRARRGR